MLNLEDRSPLLVFGLAGRIGSGASFVSDKLEQSLKTYDYSTIRVFDVSQFVLDVEKQRNPATEANFNPISTPAKVQRVQQLSHELREKNNPAHIAELIIGNIAEDMTQPGKLSERIAYIVDGIKHPREVKLFRSIFGDSFYLVGVVANDERRFARLTQREGFSDDPSNLLSYQVLSELDSGRHKQKYGQQAIQTVVKADYFFVNNFDVKDKIEQEVSRFLKLMFRSSMQTPRKDEEGMSAAFRAANKSACLSRQVGAALFFSRWSSSFHWA